MKAKRIILVLAALALLGLGAGIAYRWLTASEEDLGGVVENIPKAAADLGPIQRGEADWPCWGGPNHDNRSAVTGIRTDWSRGLKKIWEIHYLCQGERASTWSAPAVQGNRLVVPGRAEAGDLVFCLDPQTGKLLWHQSYRAKADAERGPGARATPSIDGDRVYTFGRSGDLACWHLRDGRMLWRRNVRDDGGEEPRWGYASSPLVYEDKVVVQAGGTALAIAYDKMTGRVVWKSDGGRAGYASVRPLKVGGATQLLVFHGSGLAGLEADSGRQIWAHAWQTDYGVNATTPAVAGATVFITSDYGVGCAALRVTDAGAEVLWRSKAIASHHSDPILLDGYVYGYSGKSDQNRGYFVCVELASGQERWRTREIGWGTTVYVDGHLLCMDIKGNLFLVWPDPAAFKKVTEHRGALPSVGQHAWTLPVIANGKVYLRYRQTLVCYDLRGGP